MSCGILVCVVVVSAILFAQDGHSQTVAGILYPQESESREMKSLDGIWNFRIAPRLQPDLGFQEQWYSRPLSQTGDVELMPVPSSYNDVTQNKAIRDHVGWVWYDREFWVPSAWQTSRIFLRFGAAHYHAIVYVNGQQVVEHSGGALPFLAELLPAQLNFQRENLITVALNNTLNHGTVPQGSVVWPTGSRYPPGYFTLNYNFDFFNYAGIHRPVFLYTTPQNYIEDIDVTTEVDGGNGVVTYSVKASDRKSGKPSKRALDVSVDLVDKDGTVAATTAGDSGTLVVPSAKLWWPFTMVTKDQDAGYMYTLKVSMTDSVTGGLDVYRLKVGIRSLFWNNTSFLINNKPFYFRGFGRHEDFNVRGKGIDSVMLVKDHNLVKWTGANSYRTSHYPYAEEIMDLTDSLGIVVIDEVPAVAIDGFGAGLLASHRQQMAELIQRDKNRASVIMWSVSNEPQSQKPEAEPYFQNIITLTRSLDLTRPITNVVAQANNRDVTVKFVDIICINRYYAWYSDNGHTEVIEKSLVEDVQEWIRLHNKPVIVSEYGADTVAGLHSSPEFVFTEEFQVEYLKEHFKAFDFLRQNTSMIGEHIWNFADFMTGQGITRVVGNRKGIFTRERQPKASAHLLRHRYHLLAAEYDSYPIPEDIRQSGPVYPKHHHVHDEH